jgi:hypothetical protein
VAEEESEQSRMSPYMSLSSDSSANRRPQSRTNRNIECYEMGRIVCIQRSEKEKDSRYIEEASAPAAAAVCQICNIMYICNIECYECKADEVYSTI